MTIISSLKVNNFVSIFEFPSKKSRECGEVGCIIWAPSLNECSLLYVFELELRMKNICIDVQTKVVNFFTKTPHFRVRVGFIDLGTLRRMFVYFSQFRKWKKKKNMAPKTSPKTFRAVSKIKYSKLQPRMGGGSKF